MYTLPTGLYILEEVLCSELISLTVISYRFLSASRAIILASVTLIEFVVSDNALWSSINYFWTASTAAFIFLMLRFVFRRFARFSSETEESLPKVGNLSE